jgi:hypothetical protein
LLTPLGLLTLLELIRLLELLVETAPISGAVFYWLLIVWRAYRPYSVHTTRLVCSTRGASCYRFSAHPDEYHA